MPNTIKIKRNSTGKPSSLAAGELAVNTADGSLYTGNTAGNGVLNLNHSFSIGDILYYSQDAEIQVADDNTNSNYHTMREFYCDKSGSFRIKFSAFIQSGSYYWAYRIYNETTSTVLYGNSFTSSTSGNGLDTGQSSSVHAYRRYRIDVGADKTKSGDKILIQMVSSTGGGTPVAGNGQNLVLKEFRVYLNQQQIEPSGNSNAGTYSLRNAASILTLGGNLNVTADTTNGQFLTTIRNTGTQSEDNGLLIETATSNASSNVLKVQSDGDANTFIVKGNGNCGIGLSSGAINATLHVNGSPIFEGNGSFGGSNATSARLFVRGGYSDFWHSTNNLLRVNHDGTRSKLQSFTGGAYDVIALNPDGGNVGIGSVTNVNKTLSVIFARTDTNVTEDGLSGGGAGKGLMIYNTTEADNVYANLDFRARNADGRIAYQYTNATNKGDFHFITDNTGSPAIKMTLKNEGNLLVGDDTDAYANIGRARVGYNGNDSDYASFSHRDKASGSSYALMQSAAGATFLNSASGQQIYFRVNNSTKMSLSAAGTVTVNNNLTVAGSCTFAALSGTTANFSGTVTCNGSIDLQDNDKLLLGAGNDLEIYHNTGDSFISDVGTGNLVISGSGVWIKNAALNANMIGCVEGSYVKLFHNNNERFVTTSTGAAVTGDLLVTSNLLVGNSSAANTTIRINNSLTAGSDAAVFSFGLDQSNFDFAGMRLDYSDRVTKGLELFTAAAYGYPITVTPSTNKDIVLNTSGTGNVTIGGNVFPTSDAAKDLGAYNIRWLSVFATRFRAGDGNASTPGITFINDLNTGLYRSANDTMHLVTGGVSRVAVSNGTTTIGGTSSLAQLNIRSSVNGNYLYMDDGSGVLFSISANGSTSGIIQTQGTGFSSWKPMELRANYLQFKPNNSEMMRVNGTGVGIGGVTAPSAKLHVLGETRIDGASADASLKIYQIGSNVNSYDCRLKFQQDAGWQIEAPRYNENTNSAYDFGINYDRNQYAGDFYIANNGTKNFKIASSGKVTFAASNSADIYALEVKRSGTSLSYVDIWDQHSTGVVIGPTSSNKMLRVTATGIGVNCVPSAKLHVLGQSIFNGASTITELKVDNSSGHIRHIDFSRSATGNSYATARIQVLEPGNAHTGSMGFWTSNASGGPNLVEAMRIHSNQCIGIGITPTTTRLDVQQGSGNILRCKGDSGNTRFSVGASGACTIEANTGHYALDITNADSGKGGIKLADSVKTAWGNGSDLEIFHDGSGSYIKDDTTPLKLNSQIIGLMNAADNQKMVYATQGGSVELYHAGTKKLATASNSVDVYDHFRPYNNNQYTCGTAANRWSNGYFSDLNLSKSNSGGLGPVLTLDNAAGAASDSSAIGFASFGTSFYRASIKSLVGSAPYHGELIFSTGLGAISSLTERMRISPTEITATVPVRFNGGIRDDGGDYGMSGQVLSTNGNGEVHWVNGISGCEKIVTWNYPAGNSSGVSFSGSSATGTATITHNLNTQYVVVSAIDINGHDTTAAGEQVDMGYNLIVKCPTVNTITLHWDNGAPSNAVEFRVKIIG